MVYREFGQLPLEGPVFRSFRELEWEACMTCQGRNQLPCSCYQDEVAL